MEKDVAIVYAHVFQCLAGLATVVAMRPDIDRMRPVAPQSGPRNVKVTTSSPIPPTVVVKGNAVVRITQEHVVDFHMPTTHQVYAVAPRTGRKRFEVTDGDVFRLPAIYRIMLWVQYGHTVHQYVLGIGDFDAAQRMGNDAPTDDAHILGTVYNKPCADHRARCQIDGRMARNLDFRAGQILGLMYARSEINQPCVLHEYVLRVWSRPVNSARFIARIGFRKHGIGKDMQVLFPLAVEFHTQEFRTLQGELHRTLVHLPGHNAP